MPRFYCDQTLQAGSLIALPEPLVHHLHVLRVAVGEPITLFNGKGGEYLATLAAIDKKRAMAEIRYFVAREAELPYQAVLAQALPEASKMDWIIEKAVELGVAAIQPLAAQRCVVRLSSERAAKKHLHWQAIIVAASEQSGRNRLTHLEQLASFDSWITQQVSGTRILLSPRAEQSLPQWAHTQPPQNVTIMIGPEGGFSDAEERAAVAQGALPLSMGARILRTETAGLAALAMLSGAWGQT